MSSIMGGASVAVEFLERCFFFGGGCGCGARASK